MARRCGVALIFAALSPATLWSCGYSEDEWKAQLAKYSELDAQNKRTQAELDQTRATLLEAEARLEAIETRCSGLARTERSHGA